MKRVLTANRNRNVGAAFESMFIFRAERCGMKAIKAWSTCRFVARGRVLVIHGELDFKLFDRRGRVAFLDAKSFDGDRFARSKLNRHQVARANLYNSYGLPAGFVVLFGRSKKVCFYSGEQIFKARIGTGFSPDEGRLLGEETTFDPGLIFQ